MDPQKKTGVSLTNLLVALSVGLAFIVAPEIAPEAFVAVETAETLGISAEAAASGLTSAAHALVVGVSQVPMVARAMWPEGTANVRGISFYLGRKCMVS